jgi:hypothetical protein
MSIDDKENPEVVDAPLGNSDDIDKKGSAADRADMYRMGKTQEMRVRIGKFLIDDGTLAHLGLHDRETFASCPSLAFP